ncbi:MAG: type II secretion system F family protein [Oscillospiraceae bacterium]|nr:type II secretion system F family protein [Oscillospiraceae bacterium]
MKKKTLLRLTDDELANFCQQLTLLSRAGITGEESVAILLDESETTGKRQLYTGIHNAMLSGATLSAALNESGAFPAYLVQMLEIGQTSGREEQVLDALSTYYQREADTRRALRQTVAYPAGMAALIAVIVLILVARVLPVFQRVFEQLGVAASPTAAILLQFGDAGKYIAIVLAIVLIICAVWLFWMLFQKDARAFGKLFSKTEAARCVDRSRFSSAMALMLASGLPLEASLARVCALLRDSSLSGAMDACYRQTIDGTPFPKAIAASKIFTGIEAGLLSTGFRAGIPDQTLADLGRRAGEQASEHLSRTLVRFEYGLVVALCAAVALVLLSVMLPLLGVLSTIGG